MGNVACQVQACRGLQEGCRFALWTDSSVVKAVQRLVATSTWGRRARGSRGSAAVGHHMVFRVALAACPNACTMPQIRDIGIIATQMPQRVLPSCSACGDCERICREDAVKVSGARASLYHERCVGCGACIAACSHQAIESVGVRLHVLAGGRMGRHPRWGERLCVVDLKDVAGALDVCLECLAREAGGAGRPADLVERLGMEALRRRVCEALLEQSIKDQRE